MMNSKKRTLLIACFAALSIMIFSQPFVYAQEEASSIEPVQVFDVNAGQVVKTIPNDKKIQKFAHQWIASIKSLSPELTPDPSCRYIYRVPLLKPESIQISNINIEAAEVFLFYCDRKASTLLIFDTNKKPYLLQFTEDVTPFIRHVGIPPLSN